MSCRKRNSERVGGEKTTKVDVRLIAATSRNLEDLVSKGKFREDLYYRLNVVPVFLPSLREKKEDIAQLAEYLLKKYNKENNKSVTIKSDVLDVFMDYEWPGNVRELENTIERFVVMSAGKVITKADLPLNIKDQSIKSKYGIQAKDALPSTIEDIEKVRIIDALKNSNWNQAKAAKALGITARQIGYKIQKYEIKQTA